MGPRYDDDAPGRSSVVMAFSTDGTRLFSQGTNIEGESHLVEWDERMWTIRRWYCGLGRRLGGIGQFDISKNGFLAVGDECMVKFWDMENINILTTNDAEGGLPVIGCC
ncbi:protein TOPLESS-RELATED PROTEIN 2 [Eucalyptus grandis]|uniref:protein TOPLESS-RELATED PROTEIN 2 n=1 Tax=Eucalyptus grandis TaxID=71139 RepID=UPI00192EB802|nr:protein TOPLESS-RELATED PROTEIN 2 [Eucalyptus grandis]